MIYHAVIFLSEVNFMATILTAIGNVVQSAMTWAGSVVSFITGEGHELVLLFVIISFVGLGVGMLRRLIRL